MPWLDDLGIAFAIWLVAIAIFWALPRAMFPEPPGRNILLRFFGRFTRIVLLTSAAVPGLASLHILNAATVGGLYALVFSALWVRRNGFSISALQRWFLVKIAQVENWYSRKAWKGCFQFRKQLLISQRGAYMLPILGTVAVVLLLITEVLLWWPIHNLRFAYPDAYVQLLRVRQLLHDAQPFAQPLVVPSICTSVASLGSVDAMQVIRFLPPLLDILLAIAGGVAMAAVFRSNWVGVFTSFVLGCYTQGSVVSEGLIGTFFVLLGIAFLADYYHHLHRVSLYDALYVFALLALSPPQAFPRQIALTLVLSCALGFVARSAHRWLPAYHLEPLLPLLLMAGVFIGAPPAFPHPHFLEYEATARESLRIAATFEGQHWAIVAPTEQFSETFGLGQYEDLYQFVNEYHDRVGDPAFHFPYKTVLVFVEKRPFQYFASEPTTVAFSILTDPTYRNYRSPAGRSSLELATMKLCEIYADVHPSRVFYEDKNLRIYEFSRD